MPYYLRYLRGPIRAPEGDAGEGGGGGGGTAVASPAVESHGGGEVDKLFSGEASSSNAEGGGDDGAAAAAKAASDAAAAKAAGEKKTAAAKEPESVFDKLKKPVEPTAEEKAAAAAAAAELPEDKMNLDEKSSADAKKHFANLKTITKQLRAEAAANATKMADLEKRTNSTIPTAEEVRLRAEHKAMSDRVSILDLQSHPDFVRQYVEPKNKLVAGVSQVLTDNAITGIDVASLIGKPRAEFAKTVNELAAKLPPFEQATFVADMRQAFTLDASGKEALSKAGELRTQIASQAQQRARAAFEETWKGADFSAEKTQALTVPADASPEERASIEGYNSGLAGIRAAAEKMAFEGTDERGISLTASKAATFDFLQKHALPRMEMEFRKARSLIADMAKEITDLKAARGAGGGSSGEGGESSTEEASHQAAADKVFK